MNRVTQNRYFNDKNALQKRWKETLEQVIIPDLHLLNEKKQKIVEDFHALMKRGVHLTPNQLNLLESLYESICKAKGYESVEVKHDIKKRYV